METFTLKSDFILDLTSDLWPIASSFNICFPMIMMVIQHQRGFYMLWRTHMISNMFILKNTEEFRFYLSRMSKCPYLNQCGLKKKKNQCLDIMKINELVGWLYFSFIQRLFWQHMIELECAMCIINNGRKTRITLC